MSRLHARIGTLRQLEIFLAVYDGGSIKAAAASLHLTQPTVSMQIKKLSEAVGMPLYDLLGRKLVFTEAGHELSLTAREVLNQFERLDMKLARMRGLTTGTLKLAVVTTSKYFIPHLLGPFCEQYPDIDIELTVGNRQKIIDRMVMGLDDFYVFSHPPKDIETDSIEFLDNPLVVIAPEGHALAQKKRLSLNHISKENFLMREEGSGTRYAIEEFMKRQGCALNIRMTIESNEAIKHSVMSGLGISILSSHTLTYGGDAGLVRLNVAKTPIEAHWHFVWLKAKEHTVLGQAFLEYVQREGRPLVEDELKKSGIH